MEPIKEIGEFKLTFVPNDDVNDNVMVEEFFFKPSFENIMKIGNPREIVESFAILSGYEINDVISRALSAFGNIPNCILKTVKSKSYGAKILSTAMHVLRCCCYSDASPLTGHYKSGKRGLVYVPGLMPIHMIIANARNLMEHGVIGKANLKIPARDEQGYSTEFNAAEYITSARVNFNMPLSEARTLSMTELHMLIKQKFPERKGLTRDQINNLTAQYELERDQALGKKPKTHEWKQMNLADLQNKGKK